MNPVAARDVSTKLLDCLVSFDGSVGRVIGYGDGDREIPPLKLYKWKPIDRTFSQNCTRVGQLQIKLHRPILGYYNLGYTSVYLSYDPSRNRYIQGVSARNINVLGQYHNRNAYVIEKLAGDIVGATRHHYPTIHEAIDDISVGEKEAVALSLDVNLVRSQGWSTLYLFNRGLRVGKLQHRSNTWRYVKLNPLYNFEEDFTL